MDETLWGKIETKVRRLVFDLLEPSVNRVAEHKETLEDMRRTDESLSKKIDNLEITTERLTKRVSLVDDFSRKIMQFDANMKVQESTFAHDREAMNDQLEMFLKQLTNSEENIAILQGQSQSLRTDLVNLTFETNNSKQVLSNRIENNREDLIQMVKNIDAKSFDLSNYLSILDKKFLNFVKDFDEIDVIAKKAQHSGEDNNNQLKLIFKNFASFKKESKDQIDKVRQMSTQFSQTLTDQMKVLKDKFVTETPILNQLQISENLHAVLDLKNKKMLAEFEKIKFSEWEFGNIPGYIDDKIYSAKQRTQAAIDRPLPREESKIMSVSEVPEKKVESAKPEKNSRRRSTIRGVEEVKVVEKGKVLETVKEVEKESELVDEREVKKDIEKITGNFREPQEVMITEKINTFVPEKINNFAPEKVNVFKEKIDDTSSEMSSSSESNRELDLDELQKNSEAIAKMIGVKDFTEDIDMLHEDLCRTQDELRDGIKRLQNADIGLEEKLQIILKKQYENTVKVDELKSYQQTMTENAESDKNSLLEEITFLEKKINSEQEKMSQKFEDLTLDFSSLSDKVGKNLKDLTEKFQYFTENTNETLEVQQEKLVVFYADIMKKTQIIELQVQQAVYECNSSVSQRKRDHSDNIAEFKRIHQIFDRVHSKADLLNDSIENFNRSLQLLVELSKINHVLLQQDEIDRESIALFGVKGGKHGSSRSVSLSKPSISIDKQCLSCSGQPNFVTSAFKLACLAYSPTSVIFKDIVYERSEMLEIQKRIIDGISDDPEDFSGLYESNKQTYSMKPIQWKSNFSISQPMVSATPDLPPLSFPKRHKNNNT